MIMTSSMTSSPAPIGRLGVMPKKTDKTADRDETLTFINTGLDLIMNDDGISFLEYTHLYTSVYNYCTSSGMHRGPKGNYRCMFYKHHLALNSKLNHDFP